MGKSGNPLVLETRDRRVVACYPDHFLENVMLITGQTIKDLGYKGDSWWKTAISQAVGRNFTDKEAREYLDSFVRPVSIPLRERGSVGWEANIEAHDEHEQNNIAKVGEHMRELMRVPTIVRGAIMPDACPSDQRMGTIPVGGVVATKEAIHPGMHSADICCSMAISIFNTDTDATKLLNHGMQFSHFGGGGRPRGQQIKPDAALLNRIEENMFLKPLLSVAIEHFATQGDGNHFFYVGRQKSTDRVALVTHHGSRGLGAQLYKVGMKCAENWRRKISPETHEHNAWIPSETDDGRDYWEALQIVRDWTKQNHFAIHGLVATTADMPWHRFWNEHNFVFRRTDGLFYHAKGATPAYKGFAADDTGLTLIPLNMAEPILITRGLDAPNGLGFAPHGAGRNFSRTAFMKLHPNCSVDQLIAEEAPGIDVRYFCGVPDISELPGAYKNASTVRSQIGKFGLAEVVDTIEPIGNIMAGDWQANAPWRRGRRKTDETDHTKL
jgi:tRNA-splicing ligase RtcB (3'-phosphate/5'-hydroxy nucleic acid ligase)